MECHELCATLSCLVYYECITILPDIPPISETDSIIFVTFLITVKKVERATLKLIRSMLQSLCHIVFEDLCRYKNFKFNFKYLCNFNPGTHTNIRFFFHYITHRSVKFHSQNGIRVTVVAYFCAFPKVTHCECTRGWKTNDSHQTAAEQSLDNANILSICMETQKNRRKYRWRKNCFFLRHVYIMYLHSISTLLNTISDLILIYKVYYCTSSYLQHSKFIST